MATVTGSTKISSFTLSASVDTTAETATIKLYWTNPKVKLATVTVDQEDATASIGGSYGTVSLKGTITADWTDDEITYSCKVGSKSYNGTLVSW